MDITDVLIDCKILGIEPMSSSSIAGAGGLISSNNLSDVANATTSRTNLGAQSLTIIGSGSPSAVSGVVGDGYFDSTARTWYVCTVAGAPGTWQSTTGSGDLLAANNLSDVSNATTSRTNLGAQRLTIIGSGSPSAVAGGIGDGYFDSTARIWYVCTVAGAPGTWLSTTGSGNLLAANNLSDVANLQTSRANLSVPRITNGSGSPSGVVSGDVNDLYVNNAANVLYRCTTAGTASTAVWSIVSAIPVNGTQIVNTTPFQAISNTTYITALSSPVCNIILPVSPVVGDRITVLSYAAGGFSITKGTAGILQVDGYAVATNVNSTAIGDGISLLCVNTSGGGQWINTAIFNTLLADSTVKLPRLVANSLATPSNPVVISTVAPSVNQQLTATSATNATWQTPFSYTAISAFKLSPIVVPSGSGVSIAIFTSVPINSDSAYNVLTGVFTVPAGKAGVWLLNYNIRHTSTGSPGNPLYWLDAAIYKNGVYGSLEYTSSRMNLANGNIGAAFNSSNILTNLVAGDQITVRYINNGNTSVTINSLNLTFQWISK